MPRTTGLGHRGTHACARACARSQQSRRPSGARAPRALSPCGLTRDVIGPTPAGATADLIVVWGVVCLFSNLYAQCGAGIPKPETKSRAPLGLGRPGAPGPAGSTLAFPRHACSRPLSSRGSHPIPFPVNCLFEPPLSLLSLVFSLLVRRSSLPAKDLILCVLL